MALENKKLSAYDDLASASIDTTTNLVVLTGVTKVNKKLPVTNFIEDSLTSDSVVKPLSAKQGKALKAYADLKALQLNPILAGEITLDSGAEILNNGGYKMLYSPDGNYTILGNADTQTKIVGATIDMPVSIQTQTALNLKAPLANPTFTGTITAGDARFYVGENLTSFLISNPNVDLLKADGENQNIQIYSPIITNAPVFADNAAATSLSIGTVYRTATGQLMIKY